MKMKMKKVKLDYRHTDNQRGKQRSRSIATFPPTMFKLENTWILVLIVLAHQIHGIYSQGKAHFMHFYKYSKEVLLLVREML